ncbi:hypothetical protein I4U23_029240 [Adineta vaga]|nr:hypothetical protein I4U23_029240 [Adineta vaga]
MATGGDFRNMNSSSSSASSSRNGTPAYYSSGRNNSSFNSYQSSDPNQMTLDIVNEFKKTVQDKVRRHEPINQSTIESDVAEIKHRMDPNRYDTNHWKKQLPVIFVYRDPVDTSLNNIAESLSGLRDDLKKNPLKNLFRAVHDIDDRDSDRADRLFLSEAHHFTPGIQEYTFHDAHNAVQAIRATNCQSDDPDDLLAIIKTCRSLDEVQQYLTEKVSKSVKHQNEPTTTTSQLSNSYHRPTS